MYAARAPQEAEQCADDVTQRVRLQRVVGAVQPGLENNPHTGMLTAKAEMST